MIRNLEMSWGKDYHCTYLLEEIMCTSGLRCVQLPCNHPSDNNIVLRIHSRHGVINGDLRILMYWHKNSATVRSFTCSVSCLCWILMRHSTMARQLSRFMLIKQYSTERYCLIPWTSWIKMQWSSYIFYRTGIAVQSLVKLFVEQTGIIAVSR